MACNPMKNNQEMKKKNKVCADVHWIESRSDVILSYAPTDSKLLYSNTIIKIDCASIRSIVIRLITAVIDQYLIRPV